MDEDNSIGIELLKWLQANRISAPGKGRSAREQLLDVVFHNNVDRDTIEDISEEVAIICKQVLTDGTE